METNFSAINASAWHRTKIVCTLGPATDAPGVLENLVAQGMDVARINASHGDHAIHSRRIQAARRVAKEARHPVAVLLDLPGPKLRVGILPEGQRELSKGEEIWFKSGAADSSSMPVSPELVKALQPGEAVFLADGTIELKVNTVTSDGAGCSVVTGGIARSGSGINLPGSELPDMIPTEEDRRHIDFAVAQEVDWIGVSFVQRASDLAGVRALLPSGPRALLMAKIEKRHALVELEAIIKEADGVMVARGDLGVETDIAEIPLVQKRIIADANALARPVITATQMLESMVEQSHPTRAEVTDVANAVLDGTDGVMLSAETAIGRFPAAAARTLNRVLTATEREFGARMASDRLRSTSAETSGDSLSFAACQLALRLDAKAIIVPVSALMTAARIVRFKPKVPVVAVTHSERLYRQLAVAWGVLPLLTEPAADRRACIQRALAYVDTLGLAQTGDSLLIASAAAQEGQQLDTLQIIRA